MMAAARVTRDPWLDNAKMALIVLVVVGHAWTLLPSDGVARHPYDFLYAWHMPAFVFVTGYLSRSFDYSPQRLWRLVRTVAVPYVLFECLMALFRIYVGGEKLEDLFTDPHWPMWFLAALFCWRLLTPIFRPLWGGVAVAVVLSVAAGLWAGDTFDLARVMGMLPFFVLGLKATPERLEWLRGWFPKVVGVAVLVGIWFLSAHTDRWASTEWLYYRARYDEFDVSDSRAVLTFGSSCSAIGVIGTFAFLALVPRIRGLVHPDGRLDARRLPAARLRREGPGVRRLRDLGDDPPVAGLSRSPPWAVSRWPCCWPGVRSRSGCSTWSIRSGWRRSTSRRRSISRWPRARCLIVRIVRSGARSSSLRRHDCR